MGILAYISQEKKFDKNYDNSTIGEHCTRNYE
jgi:hypothetical protein